MCTSRSPHPADDRSCRGIGRCTRIVWDLDPEISPHLSYVGGRLSLASVFPAVEFSPERFLPRVVAVIRPAEADRSAPVLDLGEALSPTLRPRSVGRLSSDQPNDIRRRIGRQLVDLPPAFGRERRVDDLEPIERRADV